LLISIARSGSNRRRSIACSAAVRLSRDGCDFAIRDFTEVLSLGPRHAVAIRSWAQSYFAAGDLKRAVSDYALLILLNPRDAEAFYLRGLAEWELQEFDRASTTSSG
jgi:tetratricopeptide (TPR) repeat protein